MNQKQIVRLVIEVPDNVEVHPVIVRKNSSGSGLDASAVTGLTKNVTFDLTNAKSSKWLADANPRSVNCCCVRG